MLGASKEPRVPGFVKGVSVDPDRRLADLQQRAFFQDHLFGHE